MPTTETTIANAFIVTEGLVAILTTKPIVNIKENIIKPISICGVFEKLILQIQTLIFIYSFIYIFL